MLLSTSFFLAPADRPSFSPPCTIDPLRDLSGSRVVCTRDNFTTGCMCRRVDEASVRSVPIAREEIIDFSLLFYPNIERTAVSVSLLLEKIGEEKCVFRGFSVEKGGRGSVGAWLLNMVA